jgi:hypothetical protein
LERCLPSLDSGGVVDGFCPLDECQAGWGFGGSTFTVPTNTDVMTTQTILKQLDYTIPVSSTALALLPVNQAYAWHLPLMKLRVDFERGTLFLEGDWSYLVLSNRHNEAKNFYKGRGRVQI